MLCVLCVYYLLYLCRNYFLFRDGVSLNEFVEEEEEKKIASSEFLICPSCLSYLIDVFVNVNQIISGITFLSEIL